MAGQDGAWLVQGVDLLLVKVTLHGQDGVEPRAAVALGEHKPVPALHLRVAGVYVHLLIVEDGEYVHNVQRAAYVALADAGDHPHGDAPRLLGQVGQLLYTVPHCETPFLVKS